MTDQTMTLLTDALPGLLLLGGLAFVMAMAYLWAISRKPTRLAALRYRMISDKIPQIALVLLLLIGLFFAALAMIRPMLLILIVPITIAVLVLTVVGYSAVMWIESVLWRRRPEEETSPSTSDASG